MCDVLIYIINNLKRVNRSGDIYFSERRDIGIVGIEDVVVVSEFIVFIFESEGEYRERRNGIVVNSVLFILRFFGIDFLDLS